MQPASGFKETGANLKHRPGERSEGGGSGGSGGESVTMPVSEHYGLGYLGASLGNQAFHSAASSSLQQQQQQQQHGQWSPEIAARAARGGSQRFQQAFQDHLESMRPHSGSGGLGGSEATFPTSVIGALAAGQNVPHPLDLDTSQEKVFQDHPELFKQFQQQAAQIPQPPPAGVPMTAESSSGSSGDARSGVDYGRVGRESTHDPASVDRDAAAVMRALGL